MKTFFTYAGIGVLNTAVHWTIFYLVFTFYPTQSIANAAGFCVAVVFSYVLNSLFTFKQSFTGKKFIIFTSFMGTLSLGMGALADMLSLPSIVTLISFSATSLVLGFLASKYIVFKD